ncbi:MAG: hypothetical protein M3Z92_04420 [Bacteroidota bacterium]|nr:hypothetical protein [Bacteroidota bacterium]
MKDKIKLSDSDAKRYAKELAYAEEQLRKDLKITIDEEMKRGDFATKKDIKDLEIKIEKGFKEVIIWVVGAMVAIGGLSIAIIKLF